MMRSIVVDKSEEVIRTIILSKYAYYDKKT